MMQSVVNVSQLQGVFLVNPNIRYIGVVDKNDGLILSKARMETGDSNRTEEQIVTVYPPLIMRAVERLEPIFGSAQDVVVRYRDAHLAFYRVQDFLIVVSMNPVPEASLLALRVGEEIRKLF